MDRRRSTASVIAGLAVTVVLSGCTTLLNAPPHQFLERSYIAPKTSTDTTISYEALVAPHVFVFDQEPAAFKALTSNNGPAGRLGARVIVTPMFVIRQLTDSSSAVRTPSFMPRLSLEGFHVGALKRTMLGGLPDFKWVRIDGLRVTAAHHSDGQAGCFLEGQQPNKKTFEADDCSPPPSAGVLKTNRADGDFSTSFLSFLLHDTFMLRGPGERTLFTAGAALSYDWEATKGPGALPNIERQFYGSWRKRVQLDVMGADQPGCAGFSGWCAFRGRTRVTAMYEQAPKGLGPLASRLELPISHYRSFGEVSHTFDALGNFGVFVRRIDGQDYYNIGFVHRRAATLYGLMLDMSGFEFKSP